MNCSPTRSPSMCAERGNRPASARATVVFPAPGTPDIRNVRTAAIYRPAHGQQRVTPLCRLYMTAAVGHWRRSRSSGHPGSNTVAAVADAARRRQTRPRRNLAKPIWCGSLSGSVRKTGRRSPFQITARRTADRTMACSLRLMTRGSNIRTKGVQFGGRPDPAASAEFREQSVTHPRLAMRAFRSA